MRQIEYSNANARSQFLPQSSTQKEEGEGYFRDVICVSYGIHVSYHYES